MFFDQWLPSRKLLGRVSSGGCDRRVFARAGNPRNSPEWDSCRMIAARCAASATEDRAARAEQLAHDERRFDPLAQSLRSHDRPASRADGSRSTHDQRHELRVHPLDVAGDPMGQRQRATV